MHSSYARSLRHVLCAPFVLALVGLLASCAQAPKSVPESALPESLGMSSAGLEKIGALIRKDVADQKIPGAVVLVVRAGKTVYFEAIGKRGPRAEDPAMQPSDIFRIYSMTKPIVSVAAMMLVEEGKLELDAPVARYIPAFAATQVGVETGAGANKALSYVAQTRPMTVRDLMRHTSGLTYGFFGDGLVKKAYQDAARAAKQNPDNTDYADFFAKLPLNFQPGTTWDYSVSTDILGRVLEIVAGKPLLAVLQERLLTPLGMKDTAFYVSEPAKQARIAEPMTSDRQFGVDAYISDPRVVKPLQSGGGGMVSTAIDYSRFLQMLLNRGQLDGRRYLSDASFAAMTSDQLGAAVKRTNLYLPGADYTFGLGFAVRNKPAAPGKDSLTGEFNWGGAGGTYMWVDPASDLYVVYMMQSPKYRVTYRNSLRELVYGAVTKASLK